ncbi:MAG: Fe-S cluster assembly protein SufD [Longimicrobiales bacterium]
MTGTKVRSVGAAGRAAPVAAPYTRAEVETRAEAGPDWLRASRLEAFDAWERLPLPTTRLEEWRYTDPRLLAWDKVVPVALDARNADAPAAGGAGRVVQLNGAPAHVELDAQLRAKGVILMDLAAAAQEHPALVREHLGRYAAAESGKFAALNGAYWSGGVFLFVPRGVRLDAPVRIARRVDRAGVAVFPRTLVLAGEGSHVGVVEEFHSPDFDRPVFACGVVELIAEAAADVQYVSLQRWGRGVRHLSTQRTVAKRDANLDTLAVNLGASVARIDLGASLEGAGSRSDMLGLYFGQGDQHFDHNTRQDHKVPHASSELLYKGGLDDKAKAVFRGLIHVWPKAQRTDAYQTNRNLLLSRQAQATSLPNLEIQADDVRCSHAATVGHLDDEELFYIMSRGVKRKDAERLVVFGFFGEVLDRLPMPDVVRELRAEIEAKIG